MRELAGERAGQLTLMPYIVKTDLFGPGTERFRYAAELGRLLVPENRREAGSALIELAFIRIKSTSQRPGPPLVVLAGGPGVAGSEWAHFGSFVPWFLELASVCDIILLDQRGTGLSNPRLDCLERWMLPLDRPADRDVFLRITGERCSEAAGFWKSQGIDLAGYTTVESSDDIEALRQALNLDQICLYGASYGSHLALSTLRRHGAHIARAILALVEGPDQTIKLPSNTQRQLTLLAQLAAADQQLREVIPDLLALMEMVLSRLEERPIEVKVQGETTGGQVSVVCGKFDLQLLTARRLGDHSFLQQLPRRYYAMSRGDYSWLGQEVLKLRRDWVGNAMSYCMDCASGVSPERAARIQREAGESLLGDAMDLPFPYVSAAWGIPDLGAEFRSPVVSDVPILFISGSLDGRTPPSNVEEIGTGFSDSRHVIVREGTHSSSKLVSISDVRALMDSFLRGETVADPRASMPFTFAPLDR
ncbi:MAG: alpha/beta hydrolase [Ktedonobacterales bacterium]